MKTVNLTSPNGVQYQRFIKEQADLTLEDFFKIVEIGEEKDFVFVKMANGASEKKFIEEKSPEFIQKQNLKICKIVADFTDAEYLNATTLQDFVLENLPSFDFPKLGKRTFSIDNKKYNTYDFENLPFGLWCDLEDYLKIDSFAPIALIFKEVGTKYSFQNKDFYKKMAAIKQLPAAQYSQIAIEIYQFVQDVRANFQFIYGSEFPKTGASNNHAKKHYERFGWGDTLIQVAKTGLFLSSKGTLDGARTANFLDVLNYLNIERSRELAEAYDFQANNKKTK